MDESYGGFSWLVCELSISLHTGLFSRLLFLFLCFSLDLPGDPWLSAHAKE